MSTPPAGSTAIQQVTFDAIGEGKWADNNNPEYVRMAALRGQLVAMSALWNAVADPNVDAAATTAAYNALKAGPKLVNVTNLNVNDNVFLGGSRKKRQSKKKKNQRKHNNQ